MFLDTTGKSLGEQLKVKRTYENKTQLALSYELGIPLVYLSKLENNKIVLSPQYERIVRDYLTAGQTKPPITGKLSDVE